MILDSDKRVLILNGALLNKYQLPVIEFDFADQELFFSRTGSTSSMSFRTKGANVIYFDRGDGSAISTKEVISGNNVSVIFSAFMGDNYVYKDGLNIHRVRIWFKYPEKISEITFYTIRTTGDFPLGLSLYNLDSLQITGGGYTSFPIDFGAVNYIRLKLSGLVNSYNLTTIPLWILNSSITYLTLGNNFDITNYAEQDKLFSIKNLLNINFQPNIIIGNDISPNFKNFTTVKYLGLGSTLNGVTANISQAKHLVGLSFGYSPIDTVVGQGQIANNTSHNSWGLGLYGMNNLEIFGYGGAPNIPDGLPLGIEDCIKLRTLIIMGCYRTDIRYNSFLDGLLNLLSEKVSIGIEDANTSFMGVTIYAGGHSVLAGTAYNFRPSGEYQKPQGYVQNISNGNPQTPMEKIWVLVNQYKYIFILSNNEDTSNITYAP